MQTYLITNKNINEKLPHGTLPMRADSAFAFNCYAEINGKKGLLTYDYNPVLQQWYSFYDGVNKQVKLHQFSGEKFTDIIEEYEQIFKINLDYQLEQAQKRFKEIFNTEFAFKQLNSVPFVFELKYSKSQNILTLYKIFNFIITNVKEPKKLLQPKNMKWKLIETDKIENSSLVSNIKGIYETARKEIEKCIIKI